MDLTYTTTIFSLLTALTSAHTRFTTLHINSFSQGDGICIRQDHNPDTTTNYLDSLSSSTMACGVDGSLAVDNTCPLKVGDTISLEHRMWPDGSQPGAIDISHKGNTAIYMKKVTSMDDEVTGDGWFKVFWDGYDASSGEWGTDRMNKADGMVSVDVPEMDAGLYLVRSEVLALQVVGEPQMYVGCAQIRVEDGVGGKGPATEQMVSIPGYVGMETSAMQVNIYGDFVFEEYGPKVYGGGGNRTKPLTTSGDRTGNVAGTRTGGSGIAPGLGLSDGSGGDGGNTSPAMQQGQIACQPTATTHARNTAPSGSWQTWGSTTNSSRTDAMEDDEDLKAGTSNESGEDSNKTSEADHDDHRPGHTWSNRGRRNQHRVRVRRWQQTRSASKHLSNILV